MAEIKVQALGGLIAYMRHENTEIQILVPTDSERSKNYNFFQDWSPNFIPLNNLDTNFGAEVLILPKEKFSKKTLKAFLYPWCHRYFWLDILQLKKYRFFAIFNQQALNIKPKIFQMKDQFKLDSYKS